MLSYSLKILSNTEKVASWKSKGFSTEKFITRTTTELLIKAFVHKLNGIEIGICVK